MEVPPFQADPDGPAYVYVQVADHIAAQIAAGVLKPGARLPAERELARDYGVAYLTVRRAMQHLRERGLILTVIGRGTFVAGTDQESAEKRPSEGEHD